MLNPPMVYSKKGLALTESFEGKRNVSYWDKLGKVWTIGYGATGPGIGPNLTWTDEQCVYDLQNKLARIGHQVNQFVNVPLTQGEFDGICDLCYNAGIGVLLNHTFGQLLNAGNYHGAALEMEKWDHADGKVVEGLKRRRLAEEAEFDGPGE